jgi:ATP-dependent DNA helicase RecG
MLPLAQPRQRIHRLHFPEEIPEGEIARQRLALDEFIVYQIKCRLAATSSGERPRHACAGNNHLIKPFLAQLSFKLTEGSDEGIARTTARTWAAPINAPLAARRRRLRQNRVGRLLRVDGLESGLNVALMARRKYWRQHFSNFRQWFARLVSRVANRKPKKTSDHQRRRLRNFLPWVTLSTAPRSSLFIGTTRSSLPAWSCQPRLVIIDEQRKFGVAQRGWLVRKGQYPHLLG